MFARLTRGDGLQEAALNHDADFSVEYQHRLRFTRDAFDPRNPILRDVMPPRADGPARALIFVDDGVSDTTAGLLRRIKRYFAAHADRVGLIAAPRIIPGGEESKNDRNLLDDVVKAIHDAGVCRQSYVIAIGGGAVLDLVGFAAAIAHRGVRLIRLPTTTLSQDDSGVGVKNGINAFGKKNYLGTFSPPWAVINDSDFLSTLSDRDWRCGFSEAVKVALIKNREFFNTIASDAKRIRARDEDAALPIIRQSAEMHLQHIVNCGDPFELTHARPLDFGHWSAHKLEQMTDFQLRHGEAVAIGIALDVTYAVMAGYCDKSAVAAVRACLSDLGFALYDDALSDADELLEGLEEFREHLGGQLTIPLLREIGVGFEVHDIDRERMRAAIGRLCDERGTAIRRVS